MSSPAVAERWWDVAAKLTPLVIGFSVTGVGTWATVLFKDKEVQLAQIAALNQYRSLLQSKDPTECKFAYETFVAMGFEKLVVRLVDTSKDACGRPALQAVATNGTGEAQNAAQLALSKLPYQVYLQISREDQRTEAAKLGEQLDTQSNFAVQGIENVGTNAPARPEIRYFNDADYQAAKTVAEQLKQTTGATNALVKQLPLAAKPGTVEVWLPRS